MKKIALGRGALTAALLLTGAFTAVAPAANVPMFEVDPAWPKVPAKWKLGDVSSIAVDAQNNIWVIHRPRTLEGADAAMAAPPVIVFDAAGGFIKAWGGEGKGYEWPQREHGIRIDYKGFVWLGGNNCATGNLPRLKPVADDQILKFTQDGKFVMQIGHPSQSKGNADTTNFHRPADSAVYQKTNEVFVADGYGNHRVIVLDADTGAFKRTWGAFGNKPEDKDLCSPPRDAVVEGKGPDQFSTVHALRLSNDGMVYVADREYRRIQVFTIDGKFVKQLVHGSGPFAKNVALSRDANQQFLYVGGDKEVFIVDRKTMEIIGSIPTPIGGGHQIETDLKGNLYVAATGKGLAKLTFKGISK